MTLIAAGQGLNRRAVAGFRANANLEAQRVQAGDAISAQRDAQAMNTMGTGAGIGAMYGMNAARSAGVTNAAGQTLSQAVTPQLPGSVLATGGSGANQAINQTLQSEIAKQAAIDAGASAVTTGSTGAVTTGSTGAVTTGGAGAVTTGGAGAAGAGAGGGAMSSIAAIAGPLAIGLGAAYLITKLFD